MLPGSEFLCRNQICGMKKKLFFIGALIPLLASARPDIPVLFVVVCIYVLLQRKWCVELKISSDK